MDQRQALAGKGKRRRCLQPGAIVFAQRAFPRIAVVVFDIGQPHRLARPQALVLGVIAIECGRPGLTHGDLLRRVVPVPRIGRIECAPVIARLLHFAEHEDRADCRQALAHRLPEIDRYVSRHIGAISVDAIVAHPHLHRLADMLAHARFRPVEIDDIGPVPPRGRAEIAIPCFLIPVGVVAAQLVVPRGVVGDEVEDDVEALFMRGIDEGPEILLAAEFGVHIVIALHRIGRAERALAVLLPDGMDRHQPQHIDAQFLEARQLFLRGLEGAFRGELAGVDLVQHRIARPFGILQLDEGLWLPCLVACLSYIGGLLTHRPCTARDEGDGGHTHCGALHAASPGTLTRSMASAAMASVAAAKAMVQIGSVGKNAFMIEPITVATSSWGTTMKTLNRPI